MLEALVSILLFAVPSAVGYTAARKLARPCLPLLGLCVGFGVLAFASSVPYAALSLTLIFLFCVAVGYVAGRIRSSRHPKLPTDVA